MSCLPNGTGDKESGGRGKAGGGGGGALVCCDDNQSELPGFCSSRVMAKLFLGGTLTDSDHVGLVILVVYSDV